MTTTTATSNAQQPIVLKSYRPIIFDINRSIIFDVDLVKDYLSPSLPYIGFLSVTRHWRNNLDVELWPLPEGMEEAELLGYEFYRTNAVLNGERLYVSHDHVAEFIQAQGLMDSIVANQQINPNEYSGAKTVNYTVPFELQKWSKNSFYLTFIDKAARDTVSQYPVDLIRAAKISHLNGRGFLSQALSPHKILNRSIEDLDHSLLPCCIDVQPKSPARVLVFSSKEPFFQCNGIETTMEIPKLWNIVKSLRVCSWECDCDYFEVFGSLNIIYLLSRYFNCIPVSGLACGFDSRLDLAENWEQDFLPGADVVISEEVRVEVERISHGWKRRTEPTVYQITHRYRYDKPLDTCFKSDRPLQELKETLYYLMGIAAMVSDRPSAIMLEEDLCGPLKYDDLSSESICFLLQQYYDFELCSYQDGAVEIDLYYLWEFDEDVQRTDPEGELELPQKYGRAGVIDCIAMMDGDVVLEQEEHSTQQIQELDKPQRAEVPNQSTQTIFWITEESRYLNSKMTCVKTNKTHAQVKQDIYYLLGEAGEIINREWGKGIDETQPENEGICHLLIKYYGYELCEYDKSAIEIDTAWISDAEDPDLPTRNKTWLMYLNLTHFRLGLYSELTSMIRHDININRMDQYPWSNVHQSVTGWDCGEHIIEAPFCQFNSAEDAKQYGRQCLGLYSAPGYDTVARLRSSKPRIESDLDPDPIFSKRDLILLKHPNPGNPVDYSDRDNWIVKDSNNKDMYIPSNCKRLYAEAVPLRA